MLRLLLGVDGDLPGYMESRIAAASKGLRGAAGTIGRIGLIRFRSDVTSAGLGQRLANAWRANVYPREGVQTLSPAVLIFTKAPKLVAAFEDGGSIRPVKGSTYLWIPTENVPRAGLGGRRMRPTEVEDRFGDLDIIPNPQRRGSFLAITQAVKAKSGRGFRRASAKRVAAGRDVETLIMFVLVRQVTLRKRLNVAQVEADLQRDWPDIAARELARTMGQGDN